MAFENYGLLPMQYNGFILPLVSCLVYCIFIMIQHTVYWATPPSLNVGKRRIGVPKIRVSFFSRTLVRTESSSSCAYTLLYDYFCSIFPG